MKDREAWAAIMALGGREYDVKLDCERLGLHPYLAQQRKSWLPRGATKPMMRSTPLFPRYLFLPVHEARARQLHYVRGLIGHSYLLSSGETIWTCPAEVIFGIAKAENEGRFDEVPPELGDKVRLKGSGALSTMELLVSCLDDRTAQVFSPLFNNGARVTVKVADLVRAI
jgi:hypothetical protein